MRKSLATLVAVVATALLAPLAAEARGEPAGGPVSVQLELPVGFTPSTTLCPEGRAHYGISSGGQVGSGVNCIESVTPVACPDFCEDAVVFMSLTLPAGRINYSVTLHETVTCNDPFCLTLTIAQEWEERCRTRQVPSADSVALPWREAELPSSTVLHSSS